MSSFFIDAEHADENGLVKIGGKLTPDWLLDAYTHGIFPWPFPDPRQQGRFLLGWFSVDPRCIFEFEQFHISRRLTRTCQNGRFQVTSDTNFSGVIRGCAERHNRHETWITPEMTAAYIELHRRGYAHSVETWLGHELVGGVYGVAINGLFAAESMFFRERDASKVALVALIKHLQRQHFRLVDIQVRTDHTARFGAVEIVRSEYLRRLQNALKCEADFGNIVPQQEND
jgi:leucyl/phenylalanyl-tRNA--protein transferase